ncbi:MAG: TGS domain-containing protein [Candidatus Parvarchaeota archaeon]|nr:TGS domain-containing protein [Candidatus Parvarchaeota archaeon]
MPINAPQEYYDLEERYSKEKDLEEKQNILKEMMRILPKHKGSDREFASLKRRMSLLKKESGRHPQIHRTISIRKRWPRICLVGYPPEEIIKLFNLTKISSVYYGIVRTGTIQVQLICVQEASRYKDLISQSEIVISKEKLPDFGKLQLVEAVPDVEGAEKMYGIIGVYTEESKDAIAIKKGESVRDLSKRLKIDVKKNSYAIVYGTNLKFQGQRVGLDYKLNDGDRVFIKV